MDFVNILQSSLRSALGPDAAAYALLAIGLNMQFGHAGLANLGQVGFMLIGAYGVGVTVATLGWSMWLGIFIGLGLCAVFALLMGLPTLKLRADYFAITTIAAAEILRFVTRSTSAVDVTGGPYGLQDLSDPFLRLNPWDWDDSRTGIGLFLQNVAGPWAVPLVLGLTVVAVAAVAVYLWARHGRLHLAGALVALAVVALAVLPQALADNWELSFLLVAAALLGLGIYLVVLHALGYRQTAPSASRVSMGMTENADRPEIRFAPVGAVVAGVAGWIATVLAMGHITVNEEHFNRFTYVRTQFWAMVVAWTLALLATVMIARLMSSPWGRVIRSVREDEDVASSVGKNVFGYKLQALVIGGVIGGTAGVMSTLANSTVNAVSFVPLITFFAYVALIVGGVGSRVGPLVGAVIYWLVFRGTRSTLAEMDSQGWLPDFLGGADAREALAAVLMGIVLVVIVAFRPQGIFGKREDMVFGG
jgi:ABC-type branched-subunit amino acid transport system permease subunit